jgi:hypothetical protein
VNKNRFDSLTRSSGGVPSRRILLRGLAGAGLGLGVARLPQAVAAKKRRKQKVKFNAFGCVDVGKSCRNASQCCSGICEGKRGKRKCRAHDGGTGCRPGLIEDGCGGDVDVACTTSTGQVGICNTTTGNAEYCIAIGAGGGDCKKDADCRLLCGTDAASCIRCEGVGVCSGPSAGDCAAK